MLLLPVSQVHDNAQTATWAIWHCIKNCRIIMNAHFRRMSKKGEHCRFSGINDMTKNVTCGSLVQRSVRSSIPSI